MYSLQICHVQLTAKAVAIKNYLCKVPSRQLYNTILMFCYVLIQYS